MSLNCPSCNQPLPAENVNLQTGIGKCDDCNEVFLLSEQSAPTKEIPQPKNIDTETGEDGLTITVHGNQAKGVLVLLCSFFAYGFFGVFYWMAVYVSENPLGAAYFMLFMPLVMGLILTYLGLLSFNRRILQVDQDSITVRQEPILTFGGQTIPVSQIKQIYATGWGHRANQFSGRAGFKLNVLLKNNRKQVLMENFYEAEEVLFLEQQIEKYLEIPDRPVAGELQK